MLTSDFPNSLKLILPNTRSLDLVLVGCGGTGSWLAPALVRIARMLMDKGKNIHVVFIDPDHVEEKNTFRQNFCAAEIEMNKAEALASRYSNAWGVPISTIDKPFGADVYQSDNSVICGCVDRTDSRASIEKFVDVSSRRWWLDSGNSQSSGQILLGCGNLTWREDPNTLPGFCGWLPSPARQHPELVEGIPLGSTPSIPSTSSGTGAGSNDLSCADMVLQDSQGMAINQRMAAEAADYLVRMLITKDLRKYATYIDLESGVSHSKYITKEFVEKSLEVKG